MKTFNQLPKALQMVAIEKCLTILLTDICNGLHFDDEKNGDDLQARIDEAGKRANNMQTPWFWSEYIMDTCKADLRSIATSTAQRALYSEPSENVIANIA